MESIDETVGLRREALIAAAEQVLCRGVGSAKFVDVCDVAGVPRASAYRFFPAGIDSLLDEFHRDAVSLVCGSVKSEITEARRLGGSVARWLGGSGNGITFRQALSAGIRGAISGFHRAPLTSSILRTDKRLLTAYVLDERPESFIEVFTAYAAGCATAFGCDVSDLREEARRFVWDVFQLLLRDVPSDPAEKWPPSDVDELLRDPVTRFLDKIKLDGVERQRSSPFVVPPLEAPIARFGTLVGSL